MKFSIALLLVSCVALGQTMSKTNTQNQSPKSVTVYTSAPKSDLKMTKTGRQTFKPYSQPLETQLCIFVHPNKKTRLFSESEEQ